MSAAAKRVPLDLVEEFRREHRIARIVLINAGAKVGAIVNAFAPRDQALYEDAVCELEEAARECTYREQLLGLAIAEQAQQRRGLVVLDGGVA